MMANATKIKNLQIRVDSELKRESDELFEKLGTSTNEAIKIFLKAAVRSEGFPFVIGLEMPNPQTKKAIQEAYDIADGKINAKTYDSVDDLMKDLNS